MFGILMLVWIFNERLKENHERRERERENGWNMKNGWK
jgi:hypothetical protein